MEPLLSHHSLPSGAVVRLRLPHATDLEGIVRLPVAAAREPVDADAAAELVRFDPRRRAVVCAAALGPAGETVVGVGAIDLSAGAAPDVVAVDAAYADDLGALLERVLRERAAAHLRRPRRGRPSLGRRLLRAGRTRAFAA